MLMVDISIEGLKTPAYWVVLEETTNQMSNQHDPTHIVF